MILSLTTLAWYGLGGFVDVPWQDDFAFVRILQDLDAQGDFWGYVFERNNEHLSVLPRLSFWWARDALDLNFAWMRWLNVTMLIAAGTVAYRQTHRCLVGGTAGRRRAGTLLPGVAFCVAASLAQWELIHTTMCVSNLLNVVLSMLAVGAAARFLATGALRWLLLIPVYSVTAYWSFASGAITALVCALMLLVFRRQSSPWPTVGTGILAAVLLGLQSQAVPGKGAEITDLKLCVEGLASGLGLAILPMADNPDWEAAIRIAGWPILLLAVLAFAWIPIQERRSTQPVREGVMLAWGLIALGLAVFSAVAYGRVQLGPRALLSSRYYPYAMLVGLGLLLAAIRFRPAKTLHWGGPAAILLGLLLGVGQALITVSELRENRHRQAVGRRAVSVIRDHRHVPDNELAARIYIPPAHMTWIREAIAYLETHRLSLFSRQLQESR